MAPNVDLSYPIFLAREDRWAEIVEASFANNEAICVCVNPNFNRCATLRSEKVILDSVRIVSRLSKPGDTDSMSS